MRRLLSTLLLLSFLFAGPGPANAESEALEDLLVFGPALVSGESTLDIHEGAVRLGVEQTSTVRLQAESIKIQVMWEKGYRMGGGDGFNTATDRGQDEFEINDVDVRFEQFQEKPPLFLPFSDSGTIDATVDSLSGWSLDSGVDLITVGVGSAPDSADTGGGDVTRFWHTASGPVVHATGEGSIRAEGSFTLFVHDVMIHAEGANRDWSDWTGEQMEDSDLPASEYELRVTTIDVKSGALVASSSDMEVFSPKVSGSFIGDLSAPSVTGRLLQDGRIYGFEQDSLHLKGAGDVRFQAVEEAQGSGSDLLVAADGDFQVRGASTMEPIEGSSDPFGSFFLFASLGGVIVGSVASTGLARQGFLPVPVPALRNRWHRMWMERGRHASDMMRFPQAADCYRRATRLDASEPFAWYEWAHAELLAGRVQRVDEIANRAKDVPGMDPLDLLDLQASAALASGQMVLFETYMQSIAREAPELAQGLIKELDVDPSNLSPELRGMIGSGYVKGPEGDIDGYA